MTATTKQRRIIKAYADERELRYRITADGEVHLHGEMPNSQTTGWFLFAESPEEAVSIIQPAD